MMHKLFTLAGCLLLLAALPAQAQHHAIPAHNPDPREPFFQQVGHKQIYHIYLADTTVKYTGKKRPAMAINGSIPGPELSFTEGDTAVIYVHNSMMMETSIHWHGVILPNRYDGVSYLTTTPILAGDVHKFEFPLVQHGTYWYHSHTMTQEQSGLYGAFVIHPKKRVYDKEYTLVVSDWTDENPEEVQRSLHNATDWYAVRKGSMQDYWEAIKTGHLKTKLTNEWKRMAAMDVSDVYYDRFFSNGEVAKAAPQFKAGDKVRLRVVNGSSSTYFWLNFGGGKFMVVANDGMDCMPTPADRLIVGAAETYDVVVTIPADGSYEFRATAEDRTKYTSLWLGTGAKHNAPTLPRLKYFEGMQMMNDMMDMHGNMKEMPGMKMSHQIMDMNQVMYPELGESGGMAMSMPMQHPDSAAMKGMDGMSMNHADTASAHKRSGMSMPMQPADTSSAHKMAGIQGTNMPMPQAKNGIVTFNYSMLRSPVPTTLPPGPLKTLYFELTGNMNRYVWTINNKTVSEADKILIKKGENVRIVMYNNTMMRHPMHLHGHFFRVLNGFGDYSPLKNTMDIMPMERDTIEFRASESGDWFFHCHILYHMMAGMGRIFSYENSPPNPEIPNPAESLKKIYADDRKFYKSANVGLESNGSDGNLAMANTRWRISTMWHLGTSNTKGFESETMAGRFFGRQQWLYVYGGFDYHYKNTTEVETNMFGQRSNKNNRKAAVLGVAYTLPMLFVADGRIDSDGKLRFQLGREDIPLTARLRLALMGNTDKEYTVGLRYIVTKYISLSTHYDSDMGLGGGLAITY